MSILLIQIPEIENQQKSSNNKNNSNINTNGNKDYQQHDTVMSSQKTEEAAVTAAATATATKITPMNTRMSLLRTISRMSLFRTIVAILIFRTLYLSAMAISCHLIPDHNPGNGVLRFEMRLDNFDECFCIRGHACDQIIKYKNIMHESKNETKKCAIRSYPSSSSDSLLLSNKDDNFVRTSSFIPTTVWKFFLEPLTKWDAARFLNLAVNPSLRDPPKTLTTMSTTTTTALPVISWETSEQAHAFFPLFPWILRQFSLFLYYALPSQLLPPTFETLVVLSGLLFNNFICLIVATMALYDLTILVMTRKEHPITRLQQEQQQQQQENNNHFVATVVCLVFGIFNPAIVFFATNYSESFFATTTFLGHICMERSTKNHKNVLWWLMGICCWMIGSYTRSNGTLHCLWLLQHGLARIILLLQNRSIHQQSKTTATNLAFLFRTIMIGIQSIVGAFFVALPVRYHDLKGWERHCVDATEVRPEWCNNSNEGSSVLNSPFSLYSHIQGKHWNVGFFRYYEWKQIPNFLLAAPILLLSAAGVYRWIYWSLVTDYGRGKIPSSYKMILFGWPLHALSESVSCNGGVTDSTRIVDSSTPPSMSNINSTNEIVLSLSSRDLLIENGRLLGHFAILAILTLIGLVIAHVQISTRMICSTSPAIIWSISFCLLKPSEKEGSISRLSQLVWLYVVLYMLLGVILHVNFLPWT